MNCGPGITTLLLAEETRIPEEMASGLAKIWVHLLFAQRKNTPETSKSTKHEILFSGAAN
jgi:hypothetical protein